MDRIVKGLQHVLQAFFVLENGQAIAPRIGRRRSSVRALACELTSGLFGITLITII
jgi:hypothetical protein